jgi:hypothetical protein
MMQQLAFVVALFLVAGCPSDPSQSLAGAPPPDQFLDYNQFVCGVQPVLIRRCSYLACHGNPNHALRIYSSGKLRITDDGVRNDRDSVLTMEEVELNFKSASGMVLAASAAARAQADPAAIPLLGKPLARRLGGAEHHGVAIFPVYPNRDLTNDAEWVALAAWVGGAQQPSPVDKDCADVFANLNLQPRTTP